MPSLFYTFTLPVPGSAETVQFVMIDTESLIGGRNDEPWPLPDSKYIPAAENPVQRFFSRLQSDSDASAGAGGAAAPQAGPGDMGNFSAAEVARLQLMMGPAAGMSFTDATDGSGTGAVAEGPAAAAAGEPAPAVAGGQHPAKAAAAAAAGALRGHQQHSHGSRKLLWPGFSSGGSRDGAEKGNSRDGDGDGADKKGRGGDGGDRGDRGSGTGDGAGTGNKHGDKHHGDRDTAAGGRRPLMDHMGRLIPKGSGGAVPSNPGDVTDSSDQAKPGDSSSSGATNPDFPPKTDEAQWAWVKDTLEQSTADWIIVVGHHPVWSIGDQGPTWALVERLEPMMQSAGVALYLCGHEHMQEHFRPIPASAAVDYTVIGSGAYLQDKYPGDVSHANYVPEGSLMYHYVQTGGFGAFKARGLRAGAGSTRTLIGGALSRLGACTCVVCCPLSARVA